MFKIIPTNHSGVLETCGRFSRVLAPGLTMYLPFVQRIHVISHQTEIVNYEMKVKTKDNVFTKVQIAVQFRVHPEHVREHVYATGDPWLQCQSYIESVVRANIPKLKLDQLFESQNDICKAVMETAVPHLSQTGCSIENAMIVEITPSDEIIQAMNQINASERLKEANKNEADAHYYSEIKQAEADRDRKALQGEGIGMQRTAIIKSFEESIESLVKKLGVPTKDIMDLIIKAQHLDTLEIIGKSENTKTIFIEHSPERLSQQIMKANEVTQNSSKD